MQHARHSRPPGSGFGGFGALLDPPDKHVFPVSALYALIPVAFGVEAEHDGEIVLAEGRRAPA